MVIHPRGLTGPMFCGRTCGSFASGSGAQPGELTAPAPQV
jgi:hypothetical protein